MSLILIPAALALRRRPPPPLCSHVCPRAAQDGRPDRLIDSRLGQFEQPVDNASADAANSGILARMSFDSSSPFLVGDAIAAGTSRASLRTLRWDRSIYGVRAPSTPERTLLDTCRMFAARLPADAFFSHATAARLIGMPLPLRAQTSPTLDIAVPAPARAPHARGIRGHELAVQSGDVTSSRGIRHTSPSRTWCDLASVLGLLDLVAAGDHLIHWRLPLVDHEELTVRSREFVGRRGMSKIRQALPLLDARAESPPESMLRVLLSLHGLPSPRINHTIVDTETGKAARPDFIFSEQRLILEYQGDYHRTKSQWRKDMTRRTRLEGDGWRVMEINWDDLMDPGELASRIRRQLSR